MASIRERLAGYDWSEVRGALDREAYARLPRLLEEASCASLSRLFEDDRRFRKHVVMERHNFGRGDYKYFADPLPRLVANLRSSLYPRLSPIANAWNELLGKSERFPHHYRDYQEFCERSGQAKPTPLLLRYGPGDYNCLHQDLYGEQVFPLQVAVLLSNPTMDFEGGEFVLTEQRPRRQSRPMVVPLGLGDGVIFPVSHRPVAGRAGHHRVQLRHGVSALRSGQRTTLGIIFHNA